MRTPFVASLLVAALAAQESKPADYKAMLQKALVIEKQEQDPKRAVELLAQVAALAPDEATRKRAEAERGRIQDALESAGNNAKNRIGNALDRLRRDDEASWKNGIADLIFAGDACVAELARQVETEDTDRLFITRAVQALVEIGTERAAATLERIVEKGDEFQRKAALLGAFAAASVSDKMRKALGAFVNAHDYKLTVEALAMLWSKLSREDLIAKLDERELGDASAEVREAAGKAMCRVCWEITNGWDAGWQAANPRIIAILHKLIADGEGFAARVAVTLWFLTSSDGRALMLEALAAFPGEVASVRASRNLQFESFQPASDDEQVELCLAAARALKAEPIASLARDQLQKAIQRLIARWTHAALAAAVECAELGFEDGTSQISEFIPRVARPEDTALVVRALPAVRAPGHLATWLGEHALPAGSVDAVRAYVESKIKPDAPANERLLTAVARTRDPKHVAWVFGLGKDQPETCWEPAVHALLVASRDPITPEIQAALEAALVMTVKVPGNRESSVASYRDAIFTRLVQIGSRPAVDLYAKAYDLGLRASAPLDFSPRLFTNSSWGYRGLLWLGAPKKSLPGVELHRVGYDAATVAEVLVKVLGSKHPHAWEDAFLCADEMDRFPLGVAEQLADLSFDCPFQTGSGRQRHQMQSAIATYLLNGGAARSPRAWTFLVDLSRRGSSWSVMQILGKLATPPPEAKPVLEALLESPDSIAYALGELAKLGANDMVERTVKLLAHAQAAVRATALATLVSLDKERARREIGPLAGDSSADVRAGFAAQAGVLGDQAFVPALLRLLRDDAPPVREAAKASLDRIRFLVEQDAFWTKLKKQGGVDAPSAAEALLKKAAKDQPKPTRLMAIDSLGTLGVAETLPFLIELCTDADQEVAEHAAAAVKRINVK